MIRSSTMLRRALGALLISSAASASWAADAQGQFAIRGAGLVTCGLYVQARTERDETYLVTAAWIDGYVTGTNQHAQDTFDVLSFEGTELLMALLNNHCEANPGDTVVGVLTSLFEQVWPDRLVEKSDRAVVVLDSRRAMHYHSLIERVQVQLADRGHFAGSVNGVYDASTAEAMRAFQRSVDFAPSGFPDQKSLWRLLR